MQVLSDPDALMEKLLAQYVGMRPMAGESPEYFGRRILLNFGSRIEFLDDDLRFRVLALIQPRRS